MPVFMAKSSIRKAGGRNSAHIAGSSNNSYEPVVNRGDGASFSGRVSVANENKEDQKARPDFKALRSFWPYALAQKQRIAFALVALIVASVATLALPMAVRRVIDVGFSGGEQQLANSYFAILIGVVAVLALASSFRFYLVMTVGESV
eukprot:gene26040-33523_t